MTVAFNTGLHMHEQAIAQHNMLTQHQMISQQQMMNPQFALANNLNTLIAKPMADAFLKTTNLGIMPPKDWKPDKYAGLGPELTPQEKLKKKYEDLKKPMYVQQPQEADYTKENKTKTFKQKIKDFGTKVSDYFKNLANKIACTLKLKK